MESIPEGLTYDDNSTVSPSTFETWQSLLRSARSSVDIASFYWTLSNRDTHTHDPSASQVRGGAQEPQTHLQGGGGVKPKGRAEDSPQAEVDPQLNPKFMRQDEDQCVEALQREIQTWIKEHFLTVRTMTEWVSQLPGVMVFKQQPRIV